MTQDDQALVQRARAGDRAEFDVLIARYAPRLMAVAMATMGSMPDAEDAVQEALARAWFKLDRFDTDRPIEPWLVRVTLNKCRDLLRRRRSRSSAASAAGPASRDRSGLASLRHQRRSASAVQPIFPAMEVIVAHSEP